ncbi:toll/interleukin-1 receptor domain-containing protein [Methanocella sp. MCL-LM]|uniref:toll/interleukin-1 receptor domain-containing protein n=1 Tax=Methanocella sp. MCL-LM TaxID=3412035 RepID=UPI003C768119
MIKVTMAHPAFSKNKFQIKDIIKSYGMSWDSAQNGWVNVATNEGVYVDRANMDAILSDNSQDTPMVLYIESKNEEFIRKIKKKIYESDNHAFVQPGCFETVEQSKQELNKPAENIATINNIGDNAIISEERYDVFISYSQTDYEMTRPIRDMLEKMNIKYYIDKRDANFGNVIPDEIKACILNSNIFLVYITPASMKSQWVHFEAGIAYANDKIIIPFLNHPSQDKPPYLHGRHIKNLKETEQFFNRYDRKQFIQAKKIESGSSKMIEADIANDKVPSPICNIYEISGYIKAYNDVSLVSAIVTLYHAEKANNFNGYTQLGKVAMDMNSQRTGTFGEYIFKNVPSGMYVLEIKHAYGNCTRLIKHECGNTYEDVSY